MAASQRRKETITAMTKGREKQRRRLIGIGFVLAFVLSTATIIYTGLNVRAPGSAREGAVGQPQPDGTERDSEALELSTSAPPQDESAAAD